jgi:hypothetical protein
MWVQWNEGIRGKDEMTPHTKLVSEILHYLSGLTGCKAWKEHDRYDVGRPDVMCLYRGIFFGIEVKAPKDTIRKSQVRWLNHIDRAGGIAIVARELNDVKKIIKALR